LRRAAWGAALVAAAVLLGVGVGLAVRDAEPAQLWLEVPAGPLPAGVPFEVHVSADVPVTFTLRYGDVAIEEVAEVLSASLPAIAGRHVVQVDAVTAAGVATTVGREVEARVAPRLRLEAPAAVDVGDPLAARVVREAPAPWEAGVRSVALALDGEALPVHAAYDGWWALAAMPLEAPVGERVLTLRVVDTVGLERVEERTVAVRANPRPVELLQLAPAVLSLVTPEARVEEANALEAAFAMVSREPRWASAFALPIDGIDTSGFGVPRRYGVGGAVSFHQGADLAAPTGTPVRATNDGVVRVAGFYPIKGGLVVLDHGQGVTSLYFHQSVLEVEVGDVVVRGDVIGQVGSTGLSTGPHLHWEVRVDGVPTDPMRWVGVRYPTEGRP
jgi:murein DD-endopeptidase MepM/ murein hydrolase activator NlpD